MGNYDSLQIGQDFLRYNNPNILICLMMQLSLDIRKQDLFRIFLDRSTKKGLPEYHPEKQGQNESVRSRVYLKTRTSEL